jgi:hypothetical protein
MQLRCPACSEEIAPDSRFCHKCGAPLEPIRPAGVQPVAIMFARLLILLTLVVNLAGWVRCFRHLDTAVMAGLLNGVLGLLLFVAGLIGRYRWAWRLGLAHFALPWVMYMLVAAGRLGPLKARPMFLWLDALFLAVVVPLSIIACYRGAPIRQSRRPGLCPTCGYPLHGLTEPRCPECGTPFDPKLLAGPNQAGKV